MFEYFYLYISELHHSVCAAANTINNFGEIVSSFLTADRACHAKKRSEDESGKVYYYKLLKRLLSNRSNHREAQKVFINYFEYFSATLSQVFIQHDELGWLVAGLTAELCQVSWLRITLIDHERSASVNAPSRACKITQARTKAGNDPLALKNEKWK